MPIRLDEVRALAPRPKRPRIWLWLVILMLLLLLGVAVQLLLASQTLTTPSRFWGRALLVPLFSWCVAGLLRVMIFLGQQRAADGWDEARESDLLQRISCGRRFEHVLCVSLHTALRAPDAPLHTQLDALLTAQTAIKSGASRQGAPARHSRLVGEDNERPERLLARVFSQVLADLAPELARLPSDRPLALMLTAETCLSEQTLRTIWSRVWSESGIQQPLAPVKGDGLATFDQWLDQRKTDEALLMVVAVQVAPSQPKDTAEAAVGLLFGNRLPETVAPPLACLHRPEQERAEDGGKLVRAARQALDWVPLQQDATQQIWRSGIDRDRDGAITAALSEVFEAVNEGTGLCDLDVVLGHPGPVSPWLAIAAATLNVQRGAEPQFIFAGGSSGHAGLWGMALTPASVPSK